MNVAAKNFFTRHRRRVLWAAMLLLAGWGIWRSLPTPLFVEPWSTIVLARDGSLLGARISSDGQWRFPAGEEVPDKFRLALTTYEDKRFAYHPGIDPLALARAIRLNASQDRIVSGASTLSMQTIRLARGSPERTYPEKIIEMLLALRLELQYSKREIMELYAAHAPFGGNVVGLEAASWRYFGRNPQQLTWAEACTLAVLPNSPSLIHPGRNQSRLLEKRNRLLQRLHADGRLTEMDLELALTEPLPQQPQPLPQLAPHLLDTLQATSPGTHRFRTTLDAQLQRAVSAIIRNRATDLARQHIHNAAALIVDNQSFEILAYVGNPEYSMDRERGFAVDIVRRPRSSGSILKPLLYAAMLDAGEILPGMLVSDVPTQYGGYMPENFDHAYRGAVPAEVALAQSLNVPSVRMLKKHGVHRFHDFLKHLGMTSLNRPVEDYGLSLILGGAEVSLWEVAHFYANLSNIARANEADGKETYRPLHLWDGEKTTPAPHAEISPGAAWLTLNALLEVARPGEEGHWKNFASSRKIAWKTGTSWGLRDAWAVGNSARHTIAVWGGNASGEGRPGLTGSVVAAPILFDLFNLVEPARWFNMPEYHLKELEVCKDDGFLANGYCETKKQWVPSNSDFDQPSPYHVRLHLDKSRRYRVHSGCERISKMETADWFVLTPAQEYYYRRQHAEYRMLPEFRPDCATSENAEAGRRPLDFLYPDHGARIYIPIDLAEKKSSTVFEAVHRDRNAVIHWHLDEQYLGSTRTFHQLALDATPGAHTITIVDQKGNRIARNFEVLAEERP
ncbi:MAG: penicillin-binding protein 1C [Gammaproteobacteria bacterium]|nr:penicillin-binding protein 1C [Gammaproteobacteria bacterium]MBU1777063.1 penicillin-binding protein 1C [Gammaproteobacteria bacterium]MBU1969144.1 penicillin-binding protein 1C [Gammaproteobacteria bacterium]